MKNNLFYYATKELSQDAFICWLMSYALEGSEPDDALRECALNTLKRFVPELDLAHTSLESVERQKNSIDVLLTAACNGTRYKIVVEDKTYTREHGNQLVRYLDLIKEMYPNCEARGVYYKTGFQSDLSEPTAAGYQVVMCNNILELFAPYTKLITNRIFLDYYEYWKDYYQSAFSYASVPLTDWCSNQFYAFCDDLKRGEFAKSQNAWMNYRYVSNPAGGFYGMWAGVDDCDFCVLGEAVSFGIQLEARNKNSQFVCPIVLKMWIQEKETRSVSAKELREKIVFDERWNYRPELYHFKRPGRLASGEAMTIGIYDPGFEVVNSHNLNDAISNAFEDYKRFLATLRDSFEVPGGIAKN